MIVRERGKDLDDMTSQKVVLIAGASSGIGYSAAEKLARKGYRVYGGARRVGKMAPLKEIGVVPLSLDVTEQYSCENCVETVLAAEGRIDVLFCNAGYGSLGAIEVVPLEEAQRQLDVNVMGVARMVKLVLPTMRAQRSGRIMVTSSVVGRVTTYLGGWYPVSKFALEALANSIRMDVADFGIDVSVLEPAGVATEWGIIAADHLEESGRDTAYEEESRTVAATYRTMYSSDRSGVFMNSVDKVGDLVVRIVGASRPRTRYQDGLVARMSVLMSRHVPDRLLDRMMKRIVSK